jgi:DNA repair exonuclease SbcCD nuclease subunit
VKIIHAADVHLDSPLQGLARYPGAPVDAIRQATGRALAALVDTCVIENAAILIIAGDLFDGAWRDYRTGLTFVKEMNRLRDVGTRVLVVRGNHDAESAIARTLDWPAHVTFFSASLPESVKFEELGVAVTGQSFATRAVIDDLSARYPPPVPGLLNFAVLHTSADGREGHATYAPCSVSNLRASGYDYWALGHVHAREVLSEAPWVVFPGNLQGRHARELGPKGATVVTIEGGAITQVLHRTLDVVRWEQLDVIVKEPSHDHVLDATIDAVDAQRKAEPNALLALRVNFRVPAPLAPWFEAQRSILEAAVRTEIGRVRDNVWFEKMHLAVQASPQPAFASLVHGLIDADSQLVSTLRDELKPLLKKLPPAAIDGLGDDVDMIRLLDEARALLAHRMNEAE